MKTKYKSSLTTFQCMTKERYIFKQYDPRCIPVEKGTTFLPLRLPPVAGVDDVASGTSVIK
eukprot:scaffold180789_cov71-Attheya_sp.AAC.1